MSYNIMGEYINDAIEDLESRLLMALDELDPQEIAQANEDHNTVHEICCHFLTCSWACS